MHQVRVNTGSESSSAQFGGKYKDLHLSMATGLPAVNDVEPLLRHAHVFG